MKTATVRNIIFDLGGVLLQWNPDALVQKQYADPTVRERILRDVFQHPDWIELDKGSFTESEGIRRFAARSGLPEQVFRSLMQAVREYLRPIPESVRLLEDMKARGVGVYCLSNMHAEVFDYLQTHHTFLGRFDGTVVSAEVGLVKPDPRIYQLVLNRFHLEADTTVFTDDHPANLAAASNLGIRTILFQGAEDCRRQMEKLIAAGAAGD